MARQTPKIVPKPSLITYLVNVDTPICEYSGIPSLKTGRDGNIEEGSPLTFSDIAITFSNSRNINRLSEKEKFQRYDLCLRLAQEGEQEFTESELDMIYEDIKIDRDVTPLILGRMRDIIEDIKKAQKKDDE